MEHPPGRLVAHGGVCTVVRWATNALMVVQPLPDSLWYSVWLELAHSYFAAALGDAVNSEYEVGVRQCRESDMTQ